MRRKSIKITEMRKNNGMMTSSEFYAFYDEREAKAEWAEIKRAAQGTRFAKEFRGRWKGVK